MAAASQLCSCPAPSWTSAKSFDVAERFANISCAKLTLLAATCPCSKAEGNLRRELTKCPGFNKTLLASSQVLGGTKSSERATYSDVTKFNTATTTSSTSCGTSVKPRSPTTDLTVTRSKASINAVDAKGVGAVTGGVARSWTTAFHRAWSPASKARMAWERRSCPGPRCHGG